MTLAVMSRASLGHTGQQLTASLATQAIYAAIIVAALARICAVLDPAHSDLCCTSRPSLGPRRSSDSAVAYRAAARRLRPAHEAESRCLSVGDGGEADNLGRPAEKL